MQVGLGFGVTVVMHISVQEKDPREGCDVSEDFVNDS